jgi:hypothetical protein
MGEDFWYKDNIDVVTLFISSLFDLQLHCSLQGRQTEHNPASLPAA